MKIDPKLIEGFEEMSAEDRVSALLGFDLEDTKLKNRLNEVTAEASEYKKKLNARLSEEERMKAEREEEDKAIRAKLAEYERQSTVSTYKSSYLALGYDEELATSTAEALADNDTASVFANQKIFQEQQNAKIKSDILSRQPDITSGTSPEPKGTSREEIMAIKDTATRQQAISEHMELFT